MYVQQIVGSVYTYTRSFLPAVHAGKRDVRRNQTIRRKPWRRKVRGARLEFSRARATSLAIGPHGRARRCAIGSCDSGCAYRVAGRQAGDGLRNARH